MKPKSSKIQQQSWGLMFFLIAPFRQPHSTMCPSAVEAAGMMNKQLVLADSLVATFVVVFALIVGLVVVDLRSGQWRCSIRFRVVLRSDNKPHNTKPTLQSVIYLLQFEMNSQGLLLCCMLESRVESSRRKGY